MSTLRATLTGYVHQAIATVGRPSDEHVRLQGQAHRAERRPAEHEPPTARGPRAFLPLPCSLSSFLFPLMLWPGLPSWFLLPSSLLFRDAGCGPGRHGVVTGWRDLRHVVSRIREVGGQPSEGA